MTDDRERFLKRGVKSPSECIGRIRGSLQATLDRSGWPTVIRRVGLPLGAVPRTLPGVQTPRRLPHLRQDRVNAPAANIATSLPTEIDAVLAPPRRPRRLPKTYLGIDGEGMGRDPHRYVLLAVANETGTLRWWVEDPEGLSSLRCLEFLVNLPTGRSRLFSYSFNYDLTKLLQDLPDELLYRLFRPELRKAKGAAAKRGPSPICWMGFTLNLVGSKFTVIYNQRKVILWDIFKFYQGKFITALKDWKVGSGEDQAAIERMKELRAKFKPEDMPAGARIAVTALRTAKRRATSGSR